MYYRPRPVFYVVETHTKTGRQPVRTQRHASPEGSPHKTACGACPSTTPELTRWQDRALHEAPDCLDCFAAMRELALG